MKPKIYILQRDLPDLKAGTKFELKGGNDIFTQYFEAILPGGPEFQGQKPFKWSYRQIFNVDEWFKEEKPKPEISLKDAIGVCVEAGYHLIKGYEHIPEGRQYTKEDIRNAHVAGRRAQVSDNGSCDWFFSAEDYIKSIK